MPKIIDVATEHPNITDKIKDLLIFGFIGNKFISLPSLVRVPFVSIASIKNN